MGEGDAQVESGGTVVGEHWVGVLQEGDQHEPRVDPEVREAIDAHHGSKAKSERSIQEGTDPEEDADIGDDDLLILMRSKDDRVGIKVVCEARVRAVTSGVPDEVHGPSEELHNG